MAILSVSTIGKADTVFVNRSAVVSDCMTEPRYEYCGLLDHCTFRNIKCALLDLSIILSSALLHCCHSRACYCHRKLIAMAFPPSSSTSSFIEEDENRSSSHEQTAELASLLFLTEQSELLQHHGRMSSWVTTPSLTSSLSGDAIHPQSGLERSNNKAGSELPESLDDAPSQSNSWKEKVVIAAIYCWSSCLLAYLAFALLSPKSLYIQKTSACLPDGSFNIYSDSYSPWAAEGTFQITMAYGAISFGQAKVVDVIWDVVSLYSAIDIAVFGLRT